MTQPASIPDTSSCVNDFFTVIYQSRPSTVMELSKIYQRVHPPGVCQKKDRQEFDFCTLDITVLESDSSLSTLESNSCTLTITPLEFDPSLVVLESNPCTLTITALAVAEAFEELCDMQRRSNSASITIKPLFFYCRTSADLLQEAAKQVQNSSPTDNVDKILEKEELFSDRINPNKLLEVQEEEDQLQNELVNELCDQLVFELTDELRTIEARKEKRALDRHVNDESHRAVID